MKWKFSLLYMFVWFKIVLPLVHPWFHFAILANKIYINKVLVYVFVCLEYFPLQSPTFVSWLPKFLFKLFHQGKNNQFNHLLLCHDYPSLSSNIFHQGKTTMALLFQYPNNNKVVLGATEVLVSNIEPTLSTQTQIVQSHTPNRNIADMSLQFPFYLKNVMKNYPGNGPPLDKSNTW